LKNVEKARGDLEQSMHKMKEKYGGSDTGFQFNDPALRSGPGGLAGTGNQSTGTGLHESSLGSGTGSGSGFHDSQSGPGGLAGTGNQSTGTGLHESGLGSGTGSGGFHDSGSKTFTNTPSTNTPSTFTHNDIPSTSTEQHTATHTAQNPEAGLYNLKENDPTHNTMQTHDRKAGDTDMLEHGSDTKGEDLIRKANMKMKVAEDKTQEKVSVAVDKLQDVADTVKEKTHKLMEKTKHAFKSAADKTKENISAAAGKVENKADDVKDKADVKAEEAKDKADEKAEKTKAKNAKNDPNIGTGTGYTTAQPGTTHTGTTSGTPHYTSEMSPQGGVGISSGVTSGGKIDTSKIDSRGTGYNDPSTSTATSGLPSKDLSSNWGTTQSSGQNISGLGAGAGAGMTSAQHHPSRTGIESDQITSGTPWQEREPLGTSGNRESCIGGTISGDQLSGAKQCGADYHDPTCVAFDPTSTPSQKTIEKQQDAEHKREKAHGTIDKTKEKVKGAADKVKEMAANIKEKTKVKVDETKEKADIHTSEAKGRVNERTEDTKANAAEKDIRYGAGDSDLATGGFTGTSATKYDSGHRDTFGQSGISGQHDTFGQSGISGKHDTFGASDISGRHDNSGQRDTLGKGSEYPHESGHGGLSEFTGEHGNTPGIGGQKLGSFGAGEANPGLTASELTSGWSQSRDEPKDSSFGGKSGVSGHQEKQYSHHDIGHQMEGGGAAAGTNISQLHEPISIISEDISSKQATTGLSSQGGFDSSKQGTTGLSSQGGDFDSSKQATTGLSSQGGFDSSKQGLSSRGDFDSSKHSNTAGLSNRDLGAAGLTGMAGLTTAGYTDQPPAVPPASEKPGPPPPPPDSEKPYGRGKQSLDTKSAPELSTEKMKNTQPGMGYLMKEREV
jgi:hypothetical protein